ncbi:MAG: TIGR00282 family metallophosphoesterase [candidate division WOR-3 bacterium]
MSRILFLGDVCGEPGRQAVQQLLPELKRKLQSDFVIINCENAAGGYGITPRLAEELLRSGVNCLTTGDHVFERKEVWEYLSIEPRILRPANLPSQAPGRGWAVFPLPEENPIAKIVVVNLIGRVFMKPADCPFQRINSILGEIKGITPLIVVDFHAEATAEKRALGWFLDGRVSAVLGTHTHIQTADETIQPQGTAYITDVGMCGAFDSVLGMRKDLSLRRMTELVPVRLQPAADDIRINGVFIEIDEKTGRATRIERICRYLESP